MILDLKLLPKPYAVIFDWDNTLVQSSKRIELATMATLKMFDKTAIEPELVNGHLNRSVKDAFPHIFGEQAEVAKREFYNFYDNVYGYMKVEPLNYALELLQKLKDKNIYTSIVSNKRGDVLRQEVESLKWQQYFQKIVGSNDAKEDKPSKEAPLLALSGLNKLDISKTWFVGDTTVDIDCGINLECHPILLSTDTFEAAEFNARHYYKVDTLKRLIEAI